MTFRRVGYTVAVLGVLASVSARADRIVADGGDMTNGSGGGWYDIESGFFGFSAPALTGPFWGAKISFLDGEGTSSLLTVTDASILFSVGQFGNTNQPLSSGLPNYGGADAGTDCSVVGTPQFGSGVTTTVTCQFVSSTFVSSFEAAASDLTAWYAVLDLGGSGNLVMTSPITMTFLTSAPAVPEPATSALCITGLALGIGLYRIKQKKGRA
jgi:hypothetical protein